MAHTLGSCQVSFGVAGWSYPDWEETVYPPGAFDRLRYLAQFVDLIEVNATFYGFFSPATVEDWLSRTADLPGFRFSAKANRLFTHEPAEASGPAEARVLARTLEPFRRAGRLAALLFQFPFTFRDGPGARERLEKLAAAFGAFPLVLEVRHRSWERAEALEFLRTAGFSVANLDMPRGSEAFEAPEVATGEPGYLRLHGRNARDWFTPGAPRDAKYDYLYDDEELEELAQRIEALSRRFRELIVVTNNHYRGQALVNLAELSARLGGEPRPMPSRLLRSYPRLGAVARPAEPELPAAGRRPTNGSNSRRPTAPGPAPGRRRDGAATQRDLFEP